jgi:hypothetical protein
VAWHVRCGDIDLRREPAFYAHVLAAVRAAGVPARHFVLWRNCSAGPLLGLVPEAEVVDAGIEETLAHMAGADVLVHTGALPRQQQSLHGRCFESLHEPATTWTGLLLLPGSPSCSESGSRVALLDY